MFEIHGNNSFTPNVQSAVFISIAHKSSYSSEALMRVITFLTISTLPKSHSAVSPYVSTRGIRCSTVRLQLWGTTKTRKFIKNRWDDEKVKLEECFAWLSSWKNAQRIPSLEYKSFTNSCYLPSLLQQKNKTTSN